MELTIKELASYLPYGLKWLCYKNRHFEMTSVEKTRSINSKEFVRLAHPIDPRGDYSIELNGKHNEKPLLRPLSDLTKEIEHNGKKFTPKWVIEASLPQSVCGFDADLDIEADRDYSYIHIMDADKITQKLLEWHFDIYGLIERKLAIDINTIETSVK